MLIFSGFSLASFALISPDLLLWGGKALNGLAVVLVFGGLIFFHELGHFLVARAFGIGVKTFSLGFGKTIWSRKRGNTVYQVAALPLGGYVSLLDENGEEELPEGFTPEESFTNRPAWQRFLVVAAGSVFNLILAWLICWGIIWVNGLSSHQPVIGEVRDDTPAAASPLQAGDRILDIDGAPIADWGQLSALIHGSEGRTLILTVEKPDKSTVTFSITPAKQSAEDTEGRKMEYWGLGIVSAKPERIHFGFFASAWQGVLQAGSMVSQTWQAFGDLLTRKLAFDNVGGPILIAQAIYQQASYGVLDVLFLAALISVNLGVLNLLPIPVLDGGHMFFLLAEMIARRPVPRAVRERAAFVGIVLLLSLMVAATYNDIMRFFR